MFYTDCTYTGTATFKNNDKKAPAKLLFIGRKVKLKQAPSPPETTGIIQYKHVACFCDKPSVVLEIQGKKNTNIKLMLLKVLLKRE